MRRFFSWLTEGRGAGSLVMTLTGRHQEERDGPPSYFTC